MSWIKLTSEALYLMDDNEYLEKLDLDLQQASPAQYKLDLPIEWLSNSDGPGKMIVALKSTGEVKKKIVPPAITRRHLRIIKTGKMQPNGLFLLEIQLMDGSTVLDRVNAVSGAPDAQAFRLPAKSPAGSGEPLPEGYWDLGEPKPNPRGKRTGAPSPLVEFASGVTGDLSKDWPSPTDGLGPVWVSMYCRSWTAREAIGFHVDNNSKFAPGTVGCIGIVNDAGLKSLKKFVSWFSNSTLAPHLAIVDWDLGSV